MCGLTATDAESAALELQPSDHVVLIGNTLPERMQYFGHFETLLHGRFPAHGLVVRNLGYSADELTLRPRSQSFGSPDDHLTKWKADVVLAFFGLNESFAGPEGLDKFKDDLAKFIKHTRGRKYNGKSAPRLALISPIAHENLDDSNLPDGSATNENLALYTEAMRQVAAEHDVPFVDLLTPSKSLLGAPGNLTINGIHLNDEGYRRLAPTLIEGLFGKPARASTGTPDYEKLRAEVNEKSFQFFHEYRAVNGFYIYGGRSNLTFAPDKSISNKMVMDRERLILDEMTANRDARIWAVAQGKAVPEKIDDSNVSPFIEVGTNYTTKIVYKSPEEVQAELKVADGYQVNCFASEVDFPELCNPVQFCFDGRGRLWVCTMQSYPQYKPGKKPNDKVLILEDTSGDGKADKCTVFAEGLHLPTGLELGDGGVYLMHQPNILFLKDTDGDDVADVRENILHGFDSADSHHSISAVTWGPGGALYFQEGTFHHSQIETPYGPVRCKNAGVYRYEPRTEKLDVFVSYGFANPWGHVFDRWGQNFVADASGGANYYGTAFSGFVDYSRKHKGMKQWITKRVRPTAGCEFISSRHFPDEAQGDFLLNNCIGFQGVLQHTVKDDKSGFVATEIEPLLVSPDRNFRPVDLEFGLDGALYVCDWNNALIGHMQHSIRDPNRDTSHGRIWRITCKDRPLLTKPKIEGASTAELLALLTSYEDRWRAAARRELRTHDTKQVTAALETWVAGLDKNDAEYQHHLLEALWVHQHHNLVNEELLKTLLRSPDYRARAAATRVLCYWRDRVNDPIALLKAQAGDEHPRVRLEAVRAASFFNSVAAAEAALESLKHPQDDYLKYTLEETMASLDKYLKGGN
jgi:glucose/arabinose dehydrogenase/lysophospholipase L1-like esterase